MSAIRFKMHVYSLMIVVITWLWLMIISKPSIGTTEITVIINPGSLALEDNEVPHLQVIVKDGSGRLSKDGRTLSITDARGSGDGWNLVIASSDFINTSDSAIKIPAKNLGVATAPMVKVIAGNEAPASYAGIIGKTGLKLLSASPTNGIGSYRADLEFYLKVPAEAPNGQYKAVITETLSSGP